MRYVLSALFILFALSTGCAEELPEGAMPPDCPEWSHSQVVQLGGFTPGYETVYEYACVDKNHELVGPSLLFAPNGLVLEQSEHNDYGRQVGWEVVYDNTFVLDTFGTKDLCEGDIFTDANMRMRVLFDRPCYKETNLVFTL